jgi:hypothetical protein
MIKGRLAGAGCWLLDSGCWIPEAGCWIEELIELMGFIGRTIFSIRNQRSEIRNREAGY